MKLTKVHAITESRRDKSNWSHTSCIDSRTVITNELTVITNIIQQSNTMFVLYMSIVDVIHHLVMSQDWQWNWMTAVSPLTHTIHRKLDCMQCNADTTLVTTKLFLGVTVHRPNNCGGCCGMKAELCQWWILHPQSSCHISCVFVL